MITLKEMIENVKEWSEKRNLDEQEPKLQFVKLIEETGELARGLIKNDSLMILDSLGDMLVVMIILHQQLGLELENTLSIAWDEIKNRTGKTIDGVFVKDE